MAATEKPRFGRVGSITEAGLLAAVLGGSGSLGTFTVNGDQPFGPSPFIAAQRLLAQASGLTTLISAAYDDAETAEAAGVNVEALATIRPEAVAQAFAALGSLSALTLFLLEEDRRGQ